jgi:hypothetical protein
MCENAQKSKRFQIIVTIFLFRTAIVGVPDQTPSAVPLPAALPLMLSGLGILGFASRRR